MNRAEVWNYLRGKTQIYSQVPFQNPPLYPLGVVQLEDGGVEHVTGICKGAGFDPAAQNYDWRDNTMVWHAAKSGSLPRTHMLA